MARPARADGTYRSDSRATQWTRGLVHSSAWTEAATALENVLRHAAGDLPADFDCANGRRAQVAELACTAAHFVDFSATGLCYDVRSDAGYDETVFKMALWTVHQMSCHRLRRNTSAFNCSALTKTFSRCAEPNSFVQARAVI